MGRSFCLRVGNLPAVRASHMNPRSTFSSNAEVIAEQRLQLACGWIALPPSAKGTMCSSERLSLLPQYMQEPARLTRVAVRIPITSVRCGTVSISYSRESHAEFPLAGITPVMSHSQQNAACDPTAHAGGRERRFTDRLGGERRADRGARGRRRNLRAKIHRLRRVSVVMLSLPADD